MIDPNYVIEQQQKSLLSGNVLCLKSVIVENPKEYELSKSDLMVSISMAFEKLNSPVLLTHPIF